MLPSTDSLSGGEHGITASSAVSHIIRPDGACYTKVNTGWLCLRCSRTTGLEQPYNLPDAIRHSPSLETFKRSLKSHIFLQRFLLSFLVFVWQLWLCTAPLKWLCIIYGTVQIDYFTLRYWIFDIAEGFHHVGSIYHICVRFCWNFDLSVRYNSTFTMAH